MSEALEMAKNLHIPMRDLKLALLLIRQLRLDIIKANLDPRAARIAILYAEETDRTIAQQKLTFKQLQQLRQIAHKLVEETRQRLLY